MQLSFLTFYINSKGFYFSLLQKTDNEARNKDWCIISVVYLKEYKRPFFYFFKRA